MSESKSTTGALSELRRLLPYVQRYRSRTALGLLFITLSNICSTTVPHVVGTTIDAVKSSGTTQSDLVWLISQIIALTIGSGFFMFCTRRTIIVMSRLVEEDLRNDFVNALRVQPSKFFHDRSTGSLLAHFSNDIGSVREFIGPAIMYTANTITTFAFALSWMVNLNGWLSIAILIPVPLVSTLTYRLGRRIHASYRIVQEHYEHITTHAQETASGIRVVRAYARGEDESERFDQLSRDYYSKNMRLARIQAMMMPGMTVLFNLSYVIVIGVGGWLVARNELTVGELTQFFIYLNQLLWPIAAIGWVTSMIQRGAASIGRLGAIIDAPSTIVSGNASTGQINGKVEFRNVTLRYDGRSDVLQDVSFSIAPGESLGIVGSVGSGKSSIIGLLPRLYDVSEGSVLIDGHDVRQYQLGTLRAGIAVVPQESFLFSDTIRENIRFGRPTATDQEVAHAAEIAQLPTDISTLPGGFDTVVGERGVTLSGGQKQRTSLARAIVSDPRILILDDALSAVDASTEERIMSGLENVMKGRTTIVISHRISTVQRCSTIIVLDKGKIVESGSHDELLQRRGLYFDMYERQQLEQQIS
ncbi:MAG: ABC transporter ATP-binding protein [Bacteroidota bacterium]|jgi:ATP-binding cassette subfamily B multidrug efflux pump